MAEHFIPLCTKMICDSGHCVFSILELPHLQNEDGDNALPHGRLRVTKKLQSNLQTRSVYELCAVQIAHYQQCSHYNGMVSSRLCQEDNVEWERPSWFLNLSIAIQMKHMGFTSSFKPSREIASFLVFTHCQLTSFTSRPVLQKCTLIPPEVMIQRDHVEAKSIDDLNSSL